MSEKKVQGYTKEIFKVEKVNSSYHLIDAQSVDQGTLTIPTATRKKAYTNGEALRKYITSKGDVQYRRVSMEEFNSVYVPQSEEIEEIRTQTEDLTTPSMSVNIAQFIHEKAPKLIPTDFIVDELKWKYLVRSVLRSKNIMMVGPSGSGKTAIGKLVAEALDMNYSVFNLGSTQDARATLIGNTHFDKDDGTFFAESAFVQAIQRENEVIILDELSRAHPDAWNILMPVLDEGQRFLRLDEKKGSPTIEIAPGVTFIATANIGNEYTATRVIDRATLDRFVTIEMDLLDAEQEFKLLRALYPNVEEDSIYALADIAAHTRDQMKLDVGKLSTSISTRITIETAGLLEDGFNLLEAASIAVFPFFSEDGGQDSERTYIKQFVQKYITSDEVDESSQESESLW